MQRIKAYSLLIGGALLLSPLAHAKREKLVITGSSTVAPLILEIAKRYEKENSQVRIDVQTGGSSRGIADVKQGVAQIGMVSRSIKKTDGVMGHPVALDGIGMITHNTNSVRELTREQIIAIYQGKIQNWKTVGGPDRQISVVHKAEGRSTLELFLKHFKMKNPQVKPSVVIGDNEQGIKTVSGSKGSIGYVSIGTAEYSVDSGVPIRLLPLNGVHASVTTVVKGKYPLSRVLNLVTLQKPTGLPQRFIQYAQSKKVQDLVKKQHFVPYQK